MKTAIAEDSVLNAKVIAPNASSGNDTYHVPGDTVVELPGGGIDLVISTVTYTLGDNVENLTLDGTAAINGTGNELDNVIYGNAAANVLTGGLGADSLYAGAGDDTIYGGAGDDVIYGGEGINTVFAGDGNDYVQTYSNIYYSTYDGGAGRDTIDYSWLFGDFGAVINLTLGTYKDWYGNEIVLNFENVLGSQGSETIIGSEDGNGLNGYDGNDSISGLGGDDVLNGGNGNDTIDAGLTGTQAFDTVDGGDGDDVIYSSGTGLYKGGAGNDYIRADNTYGVSETLDGGLGNDTLDTTPWSGDYGINLAAGTSSYFSESFVNFENAMTGAGNDTVTGTAGDNQIWAGAGNDSVVAGGGNDWLDGQGGADTLAGGVGMDTYLVDDAGDMLVELSNQGTDTVIAGISYTLGADFENLSLTGNTNLNATGNAARNALSGNSGNNVLNGLAGADSLTGGTGDDTYYVDNSGDKVYEVSDGGYDLVISSVSFNAAGQYIENITLTGLGANTVYGNALNNVITGNSGANLLNGGSGGDTFFGGPGADTYIVDSVDDVVMEQASQGTDVVMASASFDMGSQEVEIVVLTGTGATSAWGSGIANSLTGNSGNNLLDGRGGADTLTGGLGNDTYVIDYIGDVVNENAGEGTDTVQSFINYTLGAAIENLSQMGAGNLIGVGNALNNVLTGNSGNNKLSGLDGNDRIDGGAGSDSMAGGAGDDTYYVDSGGDVVIENAGQGNDTVISAISMYLVANVENLTLTGTDNTSTSGNELNNYLTGNSGNNGIDGGAGADTMAGGAGNDVYIVDNSGDIVIETIDQGNDSVYASVSYALSASSYVESLILTGSADITATGSSKDNMIVGNYGANRLDGASGNDTLDGGGGNDTLVGGAGADIFHVSLFSGQDTVSDLKTSQGDYIDISAYSHGVVGGGGVVISQAGADTLIDLGGGNTITVTGATYNNSLFLSHIIW